MRSSIRAACWLLALASVTHTAAVHANGRFPRAQRLLEHASSDRLLLAATYGLLSTSDRGGSWWHVCELSFGVVPSPSDPLLEVSSAGILAGLLNGVTLSEDDGCDFGLVLGGGSGETATDITVDKSDPARVLGLVKRMDDVTVVSELYESLDGGRRFARVGQALPGGFDFPLTVDIAPSQPQRVYVSGVTGDNLGQVLRSDDGGSSWQAPLPLGGTSYVNAPFIAAIDPERPDLLFVRTNGRELVGDQAWAKDSLFIGDLSGAEGCESVPGFCEVFSVRAKLLGFALSPDGSQALLGLGDPRDPAFQVDTRFVGLYSGTTADLLAAPAGGSFPPAGFKRVLSSPVSCATWSLNGIYVCTSQEQMGFALGFAADVASLERGELEPLLDVRAVKGPLSCDAPDSTASCAADWTTTCEDLGACGNQPGEGGAAGARPAAEPEPVGGSASTATGGQPSSAAGQNSTGGLPAEPAGQPPQQDAGCGCRWSGPLEPGGALRLLPPLLGLLVWRRRRLPHRI